MIQEFTVQNYRSIKDRQTLSFLPSAKKTTGLEEYLQVEVAPKVRLLKLAVLYGPNGSGKSNILRAFEFLADFINHPPASKDLPTGHVSFAFDKDWSSKPGEFSLVFYIQGVRYTYSLLVDTHRVYEESLAYTPGRRKTRLFTRKFNVDKQVSDVVFGADVQLSAEQKSLLRGNTLENISVLSAYQKTNVSSPVLAKVVGYLSKGLFAPIDPRTNLMSWSMDKLDTNSNRKGFYLELLQKADLHISDLVIEKHSTKITSEMMKALAKQGIPAHELRELQEQKEIYRYSMDVIHQTQSHGPVPLNVREESAGTQRFFGLGGVLRELIEHEGFLCIDELETSLHPELASFFLKTFLMNTSNGSQLLLTTHNQFLMDLDFIQDEMVWFCEKSENGESAYYNLADFHLHKNIVRSNFYRAGKLGALPCIGNPLLSE